MPEKHLNERYDLSKVCKIFKKHPNTIRLWTRYGVCLPGGRRIRLRYIPLGRPIQFEREEVESFYRQLWEAGMQQDEAA